MADGDQGTDAVEAGNQLGAFTLAMIVGPLLVGMIDRRLGRRRELVAGTHAVAALLLALMALGAPHFPVAWLFGVTVMPPSYDLALFVLIGLFTSAQPLLFGMSRQLVDAQVAGKALAAVNLAFFLGTALMQSVTARGGGARGAAGGAAVHGGRAGVRRADLFDLYLVAFVGWVERSETHQQRSLS
ncbi:MFS family permease [Bradyrhizobium huanghuaihaiense]